MKIIENLLLKHSAINKSFMFLLCIVFIVIQFPHQGKFKYELQKGKPWMHEDLIAPFNFAILKPQEVIDMEKQSVLTDAKLYYKYNYSIEKEKTFLFKSEFEEKWSEKYGSGNNTKKIVNYNFALSIVDSIYNIGIIAIDDTLEKKNPDYTIKVLYGNLAKEKTIEEIFNIRTAFEYVKKAVKQNNIVDQFLIEPIIENALAQNIFYEENITKQYHQDLINNISYTSGMIQKGERIISKGELVTSEKHQIINSLKKEYETKLGESSDYYMYLLGQTMLVCISILILVLFLWSFRKDIFVNNRKLFLILLLIYIMVLTTSTIIKTDFMYLYIAPLCLIPVITRAFFDTRLALFVHIVIVILIGFIAPNSFEFVLLQLIAGIIAIVSIVNLRRREQFFLTSFLVFLTYSFVYIGMVLMQDGTFENINNRNFLMFAGASAMVLLSYPLIYLFERIFGFITDVSLMEHSDVNTKLLRELSMKAPATFQHSLQVANLAQEAIYEIGGNSLLVYAGAMYHDIGKIDMPMYFTENQLYEMNPHNELTSEESAAIILSHVSKGIEIAKKYKIPDVIIDFIRTHHGTKKTLYFYNQFKKNHPDEIIDESVFTYHGPIPFSKETAVLMMADTVEAVSRTLKKPDEKSISEMIENVIDSLIEQKQFLNADITMKDISNIKRIFKKRMLNMMHVRIEYPL